jgi:predicted lipoprotein
MNCLLKKSSILLLLLISCGDFKETTFTSSVPQKFNTMDMISGMGPNIISPVIKDFKNKASAMDEAVRDYCSYVDNKVEVEARSVVLSSWQGTLEQKWMDLFKVIHQMEMLELGPVKEDDRKLALTFYSWPYVSACRVDNEIVLPKGKVQDNLRGLDALEAIIFTPKDKYNCFGVIPHLDQWLGKPLAQREADRCQLAKVVTKDLVAKSSEYYDLWFGATSERESLAGSMFQSLSGEESMAVANEFVEALFALELLVKDLKLGTPSGLNQETCPGVQCAHQAEHQVSGLSIEALVINLETFKALYLGNSVDGQYEGSGFDNFLIDSGFGHIHEKILTNTNQAIENLKSHIGKKTIKDLASAIDRNGCKETTTENREVELCALYGDIKKITDILKGEFLVALSTLSAPTQAAGDMD